MPLCRRVVLMMMVAVMPAVAGAQAEKDSLWNAWQDPTLHDTLRLQALDVFVWKGFLFTEPDSAYALAQLGVDYADSLGLQVPKAKALNAQGISHAVRGQYLDALRKYEQSLELYREVDLKLGIAGALNNIGLLHRNQGNDAKALTYLKEGLVLYEELGEQSRLAQMMTNLGVLYQDQEDFPQALDYYTRGLAIQEELQNQEGMAILLNNMGLVYTELGQLDQAMQCGERCLALRQGMGNSVGIAGALHNVALVHEQLGDIPQALEMLGESTALQREIGNKKGEANGLNNLGRIHQEQGDYQTALDYCMQGYALSVEIGVLPDQKNACECLYNSHKGLGNGQQALEFLERMNQTADSMQVVETTRQLEAMEFANQVRADSLAHAAAAAEMEAEHSTVVRKKNNTRNILIAVGLAVLAVAAIIYRRLRFTRRAKAEVEEEKDRSDSLIANILPEDIAQELKEKGRAEARDFDLVSVLFTDFKGFTAASESLTPQELLEEINTCFEAFDGIISKHGIEKIKTIGDAYMAAGGLPVPNEDSVGSTVMAALEMQAFIQKRKAELDRAGKPGFEMRVGVHTGPVVAGIVGVKKYQYDVWGDTVNTASRMESAGEVGRVNISQATYELLLHDPQFTFIPRGKHEVKGKGALEMYFVEV